jgi:ABC-type dipeptide/oligopeptide/nickel transport system permease component
MTFFQAAPYFFVAILAVAVFATKLGWFQPSQGYDTARLNPAFHLPRLHVPRQESPGQAGRRRDVQRVPASGQQGRAQAYEHDRRRVREPATAT